MRKVLIAAAIASLAAHPALAAVTIVEFAPENGVKRVWKFDDQTMKATGPSGALYDYTFDARNREICALLPQGALCARFESDAPIGAKAPYTTSAGTTGTATITAIEE